MIRNVLLAIVLLYVGILLGEVPVGDTTIGRSAWKETRGLLDWGGSQTQRLVSYAGLGDSQLGRWFSKPAPAPAPAAKPKVKQMSIAPAAPLKPEARVERSALTDEEGLSALDKEALRQMLE